MEVENKINGIFKVPPFGGTSTIAAVVEFVGAVWALAELHNINRCPVESSSFCCIVDQ